MPKGINSGERERRKAGKVSKRGRVSTRSRRGSVAPCADERLGQAALKTLSSMVRREASVLSFADVFMSPTALFVAWPARRRSYASRVGAGRALDQS